MTDDVIRSVVDEHWRSEQRVEAVTTEPGKIPHVTERFVSLGLKNEASVQVAKNDSLGSKFCIMETMHISSVSHLLGFTSAKSIRILSAATKASKCDELSYRQIASN